MDGLNICRRLIASANATIKQNILQKDAKTAYIPTIFILIVALANATRGVKMKEILRVAQKNRLSVCQKFDKYYHVNMAPQYVMRYIRNRSVERIAHGISERIRFEEEIGDSEVCNFYASIYAFTEDELMSFVDFITREIKDA
jgi:hypothetical protein